MGALVILDQHGRPLRPSARSGFSYSGPHGFEGARSDRQQTQNWSTYAVPATGETAGGRSPVAARARDLTRNNGKAEGARAKTVDRTVGSGLRFRSRPLALALGVATEDALRFGRQIERELALWGTGLHPQCDLKRKNSWGQMQRTLFSDRIVAGENLLIMRWRPDRGTRYASCVQMVDPERLSNPYDVPDTDTLRQGIEYSEDGEPVAYHIRDHHPNEAIALGSLYSWTRVPRMDETGRPVCIHGYNETRSEQDRGMSIFAPVLLAFRNAARFEEAELGAAIINAIYTAFIKSNFDPVAIQQALGLEDFSVNEAGQSWQDIRMSMLPENFKILDNQIITMPPGDEIVSNNTTRNTAGYKAFAEMVDFGIASGLGLDSPSFSGDLSKVNYSSYRGGLLDAWRTVTANRYEYGSDTIHTVNATVIMESFERGYLTPPDGWPPFDEMPDAYMAGDLIGPGRGTVDPVKEAQGHKIEVDTGFNSLSSIAAERGLDHEETLDQIVIDKQMAADRGLELATLADVGAVKSAPQD